MWLPAPASRFCMRGKWAKESQRALARAQDRNSSISAAWAREKQPNALRSKVPHRALMFPGLGASIAACGRMGCQRRCEARERTCADVLGVSCATRLSIELCRLSTDISLVHIAPPLFSVSATVITAAGRQVLEFRIVASYIGTGVLSRSNKPHKTTLKTCDASRHPHLDQQTHKPKAEMP